MVPIRTAIYGGTFNPIHNAHIHLLRELQGRLRFDRVLLIPSNIPPHKQCREMASGEQRLLMCCLAAGELPFPVEVSDMELRRQGKSYTSDTLLQLRAAYPADIFYLLMGEDMFLTVDQWHCPSVLYREAVLCAVPRSSFGAVRLERQAEAYRRLGARCEIENVEFLNISSTQIRSRIKEGLSISDLVPEKVADYIARTGLYREEIYE